ncbi:MAG: hypothetical protein KC635_17055, partial [Myxococcales bacterium]|nr:hypothetical protein [Myxococcales bacterium]
IRPTFRRTIAFDEAHLLNRLLPDLTSAHSARRVARGVLHRFDRSFDATDSGGVGVIATDDGDVYLAEDHAGPIDPPILLVPREVRLGMSWTANRQLERGSVFAFGNGGAADGAVRWDPADTWRFTVTQRQPVATVYGERVLWRVEWVGPPVPVPRNHTTTRSPADEIYRIRGAIDFLEGHGPVAGQPWLYALDTLLSYGPAPNDPQEPELAPFAAEDPELVDPDGRPVTLAHLGFPAPPDLTDAGVLGAVPQEAPDLALTELGDGPLVEDIAPERVWSVTSSQGDALTDLLVRGRSTGRNGILGPNGETLAVNQTVLAAACAYLEPDGTPSATPFPPELCTRRESPAHLDTYVHPDGTRWTPIDTVRVNEVREATPGASGERLLGGTAYASWWRDGRFLSLVTAVAGSWIADWDGEKTPDTSLPTGFVAAPVPGVPVATDDVFGVRYTAMIAAATLPDGVALVSLSRYVRDQPAEIAWIADDGTVRDRVAFPAFGVSRAHEDGAYRFAAVGQAGELTALRVEDTGVFPELRGRLALPAGHIAVGALQVADDRFLVLTQEAPELRFVALAASYSSRLDMSPRPAKIGAVHLHEVTAPATGALDEAFAARLVAVTRAPHAVSICVPAATGWRAARVRLGDREVAAAELVDVGDGCQLARVTDDDAARADLFGWLPVGVLFEGVGWVFRALPALADPPTPWPPGAA